MGQRFSLFKAGHFAHAPACHFNELLLAQQHAANGDERVRAALERLQSAGMEMKPALIGQLRAATDIVLDFDLESPPVPETAQDYFGWLPRFVEVVEQNFPMSRIDHYYFLFGRKGTELQTNLEFACTCLELDISLDKALNLERKTDKCIKDNEYILFKLIAPAALLSSEPRHNFFNVYYKKINADFEPFRGIEVSGMSKEELEGLCARLRAYADGVSSGFKQCLSQLEQLEV